MLKSHFAACMVWVGLTGLGAGPAFAQSYPTKPIRIITSPAGGGNDFPARLIQFFGRRMKSEVARTDKVLKAAGVGVQ